MHRDISVSNLMFRRQSGSGRVFGVLNDFDLAVHVPVTEASSHQRTGTTPYMAIDLLETSPPPVHLYRHDLESLVYVMFTVACPGNPAVKEWHTLQGKNLANAKAVFFGDDCPQPVDCFKSLSLLLEDLHVAFYLGRRAQTDLKLDKNKKDTFDAETLGGYVSFEALEPKFGSLQPSDIEHERRGQ
jgi:hypothetical protein